MAESKTWIPAGLRSITPYLIVEDADKAIAFYRQAFDAVEIYRMSIPETGKLMHAEIQIGDSKLFLTEACPEYGAFTPAALGGSPVHIHLFVEDIDALMAQAAEAGATVVMPAVDMFWGDRYGKLRDPFGHCWSVATHLEDLTPEQILGRMNQFFAQMAEQPAEECAPAN